MAASSLVNGSLSYQIEAVVTKDELQYLAFLCKSEVESMGRIAAGILRLLKLEGSIGPSAINQLSNLGNISTYIIYIHIHLTITIKLFAFLFGSNSNLCEPTFLEAKTCTLLGLAFFLSLLFLSPPNQVDDFQDVKVWTIFSPQKSTVYQQEEAEIYA